MEGWKQTVDPLIHTFLKFNLAQDLEKQKAESKTTHFLSLNQDIVARPKEAKCALKYVMRSYMRQLL
jgi:hypothetical protein